MAPLPVRDDFAYVLPIAIRWKDEDVYGHVNNVEYYSYFDTVINAWLVREGGLDPREGPVIGLCVESGCAFRAPLSFPGTVDAALRVAHVGGSSVRYEIGLFAGDGRPAADGGLAATGHFVHVFVDRRTRRPVPIPGDRLRPALERLRVPVPGGDEGS